MEETIKQTSMDMALEGIKHAEIKLSLEGWPCTAAILVVCTTVVALSVIKNDRKINDDIENKRIAA